MNEYDVELTKRFQDYYLKQSNLYFDMIINLNNICLVLEEDLKKMKLSDYIKIDKACCEIKLPNENITREHTVIVWKYKNLEDKELVDGLLAIMIGT